MAKRNSAFLAAWPIVHSSHSRNLGKPLQCRVISFVGNDLKASQTRSTQNGLLLDVLRRLEQSKDRAQPSQLRPINMDFQNRDSTTTQSFKRIKTRILIISDTHGAHPKPEGSNDARDDEGRLYRDFYEEATGYRHPLQSADVAVHCGDLTRLGRTKEFEATFSMIRQLRAPLKLVIAGNHDLMLDDDYWDDDWEDVRHNRAEMRRIIKDAEADGVRYLTEGSYDFDLKNGARLKVYASPYTPSFGDWAFQYPEEHHFDIQPQVDIAITHGPPKNIFDWCNDGSRAGCPYLFEALRQAKPRIHCFGHIHESWGATLAKWREGSKSGDGSEKAIDEEASRLVFKMTDKGLWNHLEDATGARVCEEKMSELTSQRSVMVDATQGEYELSDGQHTLFVNAAIMNWRYRPTQLPWLVDIDLPQGPASQHETQGAGDVEL